MSFDLKLGLRRTLIWCARSEAGMRPSTIVMAGPGFKRLSDVGFVEWNHKIETFSTCTADQALAKCIRLGRLIRSLQHSQPKQLQRLIQVLRIDTVTIMDNESVSFLTANAFSELLKRPLGCRMLSDVKVKDAPRIEFHDHEYVDQPERCCHNDKEVYGDDGLRVIAHESHPALGRVRRAPRGLRNIASNRPRRNLNSDFSAGVRRRCVPHPMWDCSSPFQRSTSAGRQVHVDGHGVAISISKTLGTWCDANESVCRV